MNSNSMKKQLAAKKKYFTKSALTKLHLRRSLTYMENREIEKLTSQREGLISSPPTLHMYKFLSCVGVLSWVPVPLAGLQKKIKKWKNLHEFLAIKGKWGGEENSA